MKKILTSFSGIKAGQKFKVINSSGGHNYPVDKVLTFTRNGINNATMSNCAKEVASGNTLNINQIILVNYGITEMEEEINLLNKEIKVLQDKISYCKKYKLTEYNEDHARVMKALEAINSNSSISEKARIITALLKD